MAKKLYYKIGEACKVLDIQPYVLRYWETEFPLLSPNKSKSGQRVYSEEDLDVIRRVKELLYEEGYTIAGAKKKLDAERASGKPVASSRPRPAPEPEEAKPGAKTEAVPAAEAPERAPAPKAPKKAPKKTASKGKKPTAAEAKAVKELETLRQGVREVLEEARDLLARLDTAAGTK